MFGKKVINDWIVNWFSFGVSYGKFKDIGIWIILTFPLIGIYDSIRSSRR